MIQDSKEGRKGRFARNSKIRRCYVLGGEHSDKKKIEKEECQVCRILV